MNNRQNLYKIEFQAMGTDVSADVVRDENHTEKETRKALKKVKEIFERNEKTFSRFRKESELSKLNSCLGRETRVSLQMFQALGLCIKYNRGTNCYFDPRIIGNLEKVGYDKNFKENDFNTNEPLNMPLEKYEKKLHQDILLNENKRSVVLKKRIDVAGVVKGLAVDWAADYLFQEGFSNFIVEAGGDIYAKGTDEEENDWLIDIEGVNKERVMLKLKNAGVATSGIGRRRWIRGGKRMHHLINPKAPEIFSCELKGVTVISECTAQADVLAKSLFLMGKESGIKFADSKGIKAFFLDYRGNTYFTKSAEENLIRG